MRNKSLPLLALGWLLIGCTPDDHRLGGTETQLGDGDPGGAAGTSGHEGGTAASGGASGSAGSSGGAGGASLREAATFTIGPFEVPPGDHCFVQQFASPFGSAVVDIGEIESQMSEGGRRVLLSAASSKTLDGIVACNPLAPPTEALYATQAATDVLTYPSGVAQKFNHMIGAFSIAVRYVNETTTAYRGQATVTLRHALAGSVNESVFYFSAPVRNLVVPARSVATGEESITFSGDVTIYRLASYMGRFGVAFEARSGGQVLLEAHDWPSAPRVLHPPFVVPEGQALDFRCQYENTSAALLITGDPNAQGQEACHLYYSYSE